MADSLTIPQLNTKQKSTKDAIISILGQEWPLSTKEIYSRIQRQLSLNISYQAVHKTIKQFEKDEIISKVGREYELNRSWISNTKKSFTNLEKLYNKDGMVYEIDPNFKGIVKWQFNDYAVMIVTFAEILSSNTLVRDSAPPYGNWLA